MRNQIRFTLFHLFLSVLLLLCSTVLPNTVVHAQTGDLDPSEAEELANAMEIFMRMNGKERDEFIQGLLESVKDDPKAKKEMEALVKMVQEMEDNGSNLQQLIEEDEINAAKKEASRQFQGQTWDELWANQEEILKEVLASGQLSPEDAAHLKTDEEAWKNLLKTMYEDLKQPSNDEL